VRGHEVADDQPRQGQADLVGVPSGCAEEAVGAGVVCACGQSGTGPHPADVAGGGPGYQTCDRSTLLLGYPAENIAVSLVLDSAGNPLSEALTDPDHLTTRTFQSAES